MLDFSQFRVLTFDCYGTLVDWESGILGALRPIVSRHSRKMTDRELTVMYAAIEREIEAAPYRSYREVLRGVVRQMGTRMGFTPSTAEIESLPASLKDWLPFPDTVPALRRLKERYKLAIISNIDDDLFADTARRLEVPFDAVITAQQAKSYKPSHRNFELALERIGEERTHVLHCAESVYHDVVPARALGLATVWVDRAQGQASASGGAEGKPDLEVPDMKTLAELAVR